MPTVACPNCHTPLEISDANQGQLVRCPQCQNAVTIKGRNREAPATSPLAAGLPSVKPAPAQVLTPSITRRGEGQSLTLIASLSLGSLFLGLVVGGLIGFLIGRGSGGSPAAGRVIVATVVNPMVKKAAGPAVAGRHDMPLQTYLATGPREPKTFTLACRLSDIYNFEYRNAQNTHYSVRMTEGGVGRAMWGFAVKTSPVGRRILEALKDDREHVHTVQVQHTGESTICVEIVAFDP